MKVKGLDGREHNWCLANHQPLGSDSRRRSKPHIAARKLLAAMFPSEPRLEEVSLPGSGGLFADFFISSCRLVVEVHGEQHFTYCPHFHQTPLGFLQSKMRDSRKREWCKLNELKLVELNHKDKPHEWRQQLFAAL